MSNAERSFGMLCIFIFDGKGRKMDITALALQCAPQVNLQTMKAIVKQESSFNPYAIGVVGSRLKRQPTNLAEAVATAKMLLANGWNFSLGLTQVNVHNLGKYNLTLETAFEPCANLRAGAGIFEECFDRAMLSVNDKQKAIRLGLSCYFSGDFATGFVTGYVLSTVANSIEGRPVLAPGLPRATKGVGQVK